MRLTPDDLHKLSPEACALIDLAKNGNELLWTMTTLVAGLNACLTPENAVLVLSTLKREYSVSITPSATLADPSTELDIDLLHHYQKLNASHENISENPGSNPTDVAETRADARQPSRIDEKAVDAEDRSDRAGAASPDLKPHPSRTMTVRRILGMYDGLRTRPRDAGGRRGRFRRVVVESTRAVVRCVTSSSGNARPSRRDGSTPPAPARTFVFSRSEEWVREASVLAWRSSN